MADYRFGSVRSAGGAGPDYRFDDVLYASLGTRTVGNQSVDSAVPGTAYVLPLGGTWDAAGKSATLGGVALTLSDQGTDFIEFTVPTPFADASPFDLLNLDTSYDIAVTDGTGTVTKSSGFRIDSPPGPTYRYISSITGGPSWDESSVLDVQTGVSNGDSLIVEVTAGGPIEFSSDGTWRALEPVVFRVKGYNADGWGADWATFTIADDDDPAIVSASIGASGNELTLVWDEPIFIGAGGSGGVALSADGGVVTATYASGDESETLVYSLSRVVQRTEYVLASYTQPGSGFEGATGIDAIAFSGLLVSVNSTVDTTAPLLSLATIDEAGTTLTVRLDEPVEFGNGGSGGFALAASGGVVTATYAAGTGSSLLTFALSRIVASGEIVTVSYTQPADGFKDLAGNELATFADAGVTVRSIDDGEKPRTGRGFGRR